ncbi:MAG: metallophosphoesterase [Candidatus Omnitrophica bacterium]|nr:metallophosphoesterase [Candidatus Omnitrophota bacterium]
MKKIIVLSDTHIPVMAKKLPAEVVKAIKDSDMCIHAGDFVEYSVYKELSALIETYGVCGNMDGMDVRKKFPEKQIIPVEKVKIGLAHGRGSPETVPVYVEELFKDEFSTIDLFIYGHSHQPGKITRRGKPFFNPGSVSDTIYAPYRSYGIVEVDGERIVTKIIKIKE